MILDATKRNASAREASGLGCDPRRGLRVKVYVQLTILSINARAIGALRW